MRQKQRGGKRLPYKRKRGKRAVRRTRGVTWGGNPTQAREWPACLLPFRGPGPQSGPVPVALALVFTPVLPVAPFGALSARHAQRQGFPRALPPRPPRGPCAPDAGFGAPPRRPALCPRPTGLPLRLCPRAARPGPKGGSNLCERFLRDRRALTRNTPRNSGPGGRRKKTSAMCKFALFGGVCFHA
jgi:hypothetical protein